MQISRPKRAVLIADGADVSIKRVEPDIEYMRGIGLDWDTPFEAGSRDGQVFKALFYESQNFIAPNFRLDEIKVLVVELEQPVSERGELEEVIFFSKFFIGLACFRVGIARLRVTYE